MTDAFLTLPAKIIAADGMSNTETQIISETSLRVVFNDEPIAMIACCGIHLADLAVGFLFAEGYIASKDDVASVAVDNKCLAGGGYVAKVTGLTRRPLKEEGSSYTLLSSGAKSTAVGHKLAIPPASSASIVGKNINPLFDTLIGLASIHNETRGTHSGGIGEGANILVVREDIGRHNVADMLVGHALMNGIDLTDKCVVRTGRVSLEIATKYRRAGIMILLSLSVPTTDAINYAQREGMCLISARRGKEPIAYCGYERITR